MYYCQQTEPRNGKRRNSRRRRRASVKSRLPFGGRLVGQTDTLFIMRLLRGRHGAGSASAGVLSCEPVAVVCGPGRWRGCQREPITRWSRGAIDRHSASPSVTSNSSFSSSLRSSVFTASWRHPDVTRFRFQRKNRNFSESGHLLSDRLTCCVTCVSADNVRKNSVQLSTKLRAIVGRGLRKS